MMQFFGRLSVSSTKFVCKSTYDSSRDSHGAGTEGLKGKRLLIAEELKRCMTLDDAMLKRFTGGSGVVVEDRKFGQSERFSYVWQAGILLIFNESDCPKFDAMDEAFIGRMIVAPMRSKFVDYLPMNGVDNKFDALSEEDYTFPMDLDLEKNFKTWLPSLADILLDAFEGHRGVLCERNIPASMSEWKTGITTENNVIADWLDKTLDVTGDIKDIVVVADLFDLFKGDGASFVTNAEFKKLCRAHLKSKGRVVFRDTDKIDVDGVRKSVRNTIRGVKVNVKHNTSSPMEELFKSHVENITGLSWTKQRPCWLRNTTGYAMELDMVCPELNIAVEYNGRQHYFFPNDFHKTRQEFDDQVKRDDLKRTLCARKGMRLVEIVSNGDVNVEIASFREQCEKLGVVW